MTTLTELVRGLPLANPEEADRLAAAITDVTEDSRRVRPGALFVARAGGAADGAGYVGAALAAGAVAVLTDETAPPVAGAVHLRGANPAALLPHLADRLHAAPSRHLALIGVTGTNGKTTTAWLVRALLAGAGARCGLVGTVGMHDGRAAHPALFTTPPAEELSAMLARMVAHGCRAAAIEVSSHALAQGRVAAQRFAGAIFTNLTGDHLDYHGTMEAYGDAKAALFAGLDADAFAILNADDAAAVRMARDTAASVLTCTVADAPGAACRARVRSIAADGTRLGLEGPWGAIETRVRLVGRHNAMNVLQAVAVAHRLGLPTDSIASALPALDAPPGRLQPVPGPVGAALPTVLVDYAHTDDALANVLAATRPLVPAGARLWVVFGCGGDRDRTKRPRMAAVACAAADRVVVTSDNPRTEDPEAIVAEVLAGVPAARREAVASAVDRAAAIELAVAEAAAEDVVVIAGKGHEDYQVIGTERRPFDDARVAAAALARRAAAATAGGPRR